MSARTDIARRAPGEVMVLKRLGALHQCRLSFMRQLTRRMARESWRISRARFDIDGNGVGTALYVADTGTRKYTLVAFAHDLPAHLRSDRVIAEAWDATFTLYDGVPEAADIARLADIVPLQEAGRITERELSLSRANRSVRLWTHVVDRLASGMQPDSGQLEAVGYLMRTTAVYGSGKFGAADRETLADRPEFQAPFQVEMLSVYLTRVFVRDLVEHMARRKGGDRAVRLDPALAQGLGIGNSTGLGMAPFIVNHPVLFNNWIMAREEAIARVRAVPRATEAEADRFRALMSRSVESVARWRTEHPLQQARLVGLRRDLGMLQEFLASADLHADQPWDRLFRWSAENLSEEGQELIASLILEPYGDLVDGLGSCMADANKNAGRINGTMPVSAVCDLLERCFGWALGLDWEDRQRCARAWYVSAEKLEPRLGERFEEPIADYEQPLAPARDAAAAHRALQEWDGEAPVAAFLVRHPEHRQAVRRAQISAIAPYGEICDNTIGADVLPIDMLRAKLSFFGATHFDPRSDRWVRICMYAGAPYPEALTPETADYWVYPEAPG